LVVCTTAVVFGAVVCDLADDPQPATTRPSATAPSNELLNPFFSIVNEE
jgi:hypothetical protein